MKIHLQMEPAHGFHTRLAVFMNGAYCGRLVFTTAEADIFERTVRNGCLAIDPSIPETVEYELLRDSRAPEPQPGGLKK